MATTPDYTTLISALIADGWTTPYSAPPRPGALTARILTNPTEHVRLRLITTGTSTLALLEPACAPHCENAEHAWQVRAEDPHPTVYIAAARAAHQHAVTDLDGPNLAAALYQHGWYTESDDPTTHSGRYTLATLDGTRRAAYLPGHDTPARYEITLPAATPHTSPITATATTPYRVLAALALAPVPGEPHPAPGVHDDEDVDNQTRADWAREILQRYADRHFTLDGDRDFDLEHGFAAEQALRDMITNGLHLLDALGFTEHDRQTTLRQAYGMYIEERDEAAVDDEDDTQTAHSAPARLD